jgi:hypothetical protein
MKERFPFGKEKETPCRVCGQFGHSTENCPHLTEEEKNRLQAKRDLMQENIEEDIENILKRKKQENIEEDIENILKRKKQENEN